MSKLINLTYLLNNEESSVRFDPKNKLVILKNLIQLTQRINVDDYDIHYGNKILSFKENKSLKEIIGRDPNPIFHIIKNIKESINLKRIDKGKHHIKSQECLVSIENAPSRAEIYTILNKYLENKNSKQEFIAENKGNRIDITFKNPDVAYEFIKQINVEKINNPLYSKVKTNMTLGDIINMNSPNRNVPKMNLNENYHLTPRNQLSHKINYKVNSSMDLKGIPSLKKYSNSPSDNKILLSKAKRPLDSSLQIESSFNENIGDRSMSIDNTHRSIDPRERQKILSAKRHDEKRLIKMATHLKEIEDDNVKKRVLNQYYKNSGTLRTGSPYITIDEIEHKEYIKNKKKWINDKGLLPVINKPRPNYIPNKINYEFPYGKPISEYNFRDI